MVIATLVPVTLHHLRYELLLVYRSQLDDTKVCLDVSRIEDLELADIIIIWKDVLSCYDRITSFLVLRIDHRA